MSKKELYRLYEDKYIGGVCGGLAEHFNVDTTLIRLIWTLLIFLHGTGFLLYLICWVVIPFED